MSHLGDAVWWHLYCFRSHLLGWKGFSYYRCKQGAVPDAFFKVLLCLEGTLKAIGFLYRNAPSSQSIIDCVCTVDSVEELTGFDFFYSLADDIEDIVESDANLAKWN